MARTLRHKLKKMTLFRRLNSMARERSKNREENQAIEPRRQGQISRTEPWSSLSPFGTMRRFFDDIDRMFEGFGFPSVERFTPWMTSETFSPHVDVFER